MVSSTHTLGLSPPESSSASVKTFLPSIPSTLTSISPLSSPEPKAFSTRSPTLPLPPPQTPPYRKNNGWFGFIFDDMDVVLKLLKDGLTAVHVPYVYGFAIILLAPYTLTKQQERIQLETSRLYKQAGVNPLAGCFPTLATIPVWIGLYQALSNVAIRNC